MIGLPYIPEVNDCLQAVRRRYEDLGIPIRDYAFPNDFWDYEDSMIERLFHKEGFYAVDSDEWVPQVNDVLLIPGSIHVEFPTHLGVLVEGNKVYHHYTNRMSELSPFSGAWRNPTVILRHKDYVPPSKEAKVVDITELMPSHVRRRFTKTTV